jgi:MFS family permease
MSADAGTLGVGAATAVAPTSLGLASLRTRRWGIVAALSVTETVSYGILYYAFAAFLVPMQADLGFSAAQLTGALSLALLISALAGIAVGRYLDRHSPRALMSVGALAGAVLVLALSQVQGLLAFYVIWAAIGMVMATVLYEPAFVVLAKHFPRAAERRRAMTAMTLVAALASFIFLPLSQALIDTRGWRDALIVLAGILGVVTVPLHAVALRAPSLEPWQRERVAHASVAADAALRSKPFWLLSIAFFVASLAAITMTVHTIPFLIDRGHSAAFAAFALGLAGVSQIPGRLLFAPIAARWPRPHATAALFVLIAAGITVIVGVRAGWAVVAGLVLLGMGNGMGTLARATAIADLYGASAYGTIAGVAAALTTTARAAGPVAAALYAAVVGYGALLWTLAALAALAAALAFRAEVLAAARPPRPREL